MPNLPLYRCFIILCFVGVLSGCIKNDQATPYEQLVQEALKSGERYDSLFLGINFTMNKKAFYTHCWELNKKGLLVQGPSNLSAQHALNDGLRAKGYMNFYPHFYDDQIVDMPVSFGYESWSPWVENLATDSLMKDVTQLLEKWYGNGFFMVEDPEKGKVKVKIDGNRRIMCYISGENTVSVLFTDLPAKNKMLLANKKP